MAVFIGQGRLRCFCDAFYRDQCTPARQRRRWGGWCDGAAAFTIVITRNDGGLIAVDGDEVRNAA